MPSGQGFEKNRAIMATEDARKLFVAGLPESVTEDTLREIFEAVGGTVVDVSLPRDRSTGRPRGFGFVTLSSAEEAAAARGSLDGSLQAGRSISVRPFSSEPPRRGETRSEGGSPAAASEDRTLYVGNLPYDASQQEVADLLSQNGVTSIVRVHLPAGPDGRPRGFGFVTLGSAEAANEAIVQLRGVEVRGRRLMVNIAHPRGASPGGGGGRPPGQRPPRDEGWSQGSSPERFAGPPPETAESGGRPDSRRRGSGAGGGEWNEEGERKPVKKKGAGGGRKRGGPPERGGGGNWRSWNRDDDE
jgi:RNA recognition motif-containing protein